MFNNIIKITHHLMQAKVHFGQFVLDGTVGNGKDTLTLAQLVGKSGKVIGFDIQQLALDKTKQLLIDHGVEKQVELICDSHAHLNHYLLAQEEVIDFAIYNLGYLPGGNKDIKTTPKSTLCAIKQTLVHLKSHGMILIAGYLAHPGGEKEVDLLSSYFKTVDQRFYSIGEFQFLNQRHLPPKLFIIEKR